MQPAKDVVGMGKVHAHVIKLGNRQVISLPPRASAIVGIPNPAIIPRNQPIGMLGINPDIVKISVRAVGDDAETLAAVIAPDQCAVGFVEFVPVFGIDD